MFKLSKKVLFATLAFGLLSTSSFAESPESNIKAKVLDFAPEGVRVEVSPLENSGLYEVIVGAEVFYATQDANYLVMGNVVDLRVRQNITEPAKSRARKAALDALDVSTMIEYPAKGDVKHTITIFTDVDCPYCKKMHKEVPELNEAGITVRYMAYPRSGINTPSFKKMEAVWCSDDKAKALDEMKNQGKTPNSAACVSPVEQHLNEGQNFGVTGTPALIFDSGEMVPGYVPAKEIIRGLGL